MPRGRLARYGFLDQDRAEAVAAGLGVWDAEHQRRVDVRTDALLETLAVAADPDLALRQLDRLVDACRDRTDPLEAVLDDARVRRRLIGVLGVSATLGDLLVANPDDWQE